METLPSINAKNVPVMATRQGYLYSQKSKPALFEKIIAGNIVPAKSEEDRHIN
nr:hypothetical protein [Niallia taxi]